MRFKDLATIAFDADDTLWHNEQYFQLTQHHFKLLLADFAEPDHLSERLLEAERRNLQHFGYGVKGFTLSMIETAIEVTGGRVPAETIQQILDAGRDMLSSPVELLPGVEGTLTALAGNYTLAVITKGDLFDQERKLAQSGLGDFFDVVEIVSEKKPETYLRIFGALEGGTDRAMMIGNSLKSDIIPALEAGAWATYVPHDLTWELEEAEEPEGHKRYRRVEGLAALSKTVFG
jgi:putative hydrolase of the HAD superfamily